MTGGSDIDLSDFPVGVDFPPTPEAPAGASGETALVLILFPFCLLFAGRPWATLTQPRTLRRRQWTNLCAKWRIPPS